MTINKTIFVGAKPKPVGEEVTVNVPTGEKKKGFFGVGGGKDITREETQWQQTGYSDREIDGELLAKDTQDAISYLNENGYEVISVAPIISGAYDYKHEVKFGGPNCGGGGYGYGYGYSYTEGVLITAKKVD